MSLLSLLFILICPEYIFIFFLTDPKLLNCIVKEQNTLLLGNHIYLSQAQQ